MNIIDKFRLDGKKAYVTGGARGIGKSVALAFAQAGADVAVVDLDLDGAEKTADEIKSYGVKSIAVKADISKPEDVDKMIKEIVNAFGTIDVAFNNAGICINKNVEDMSLEEWRKVIDVNLTGTYMTTKAVGLIMVKNRKGSIINTASMAAHIIPDAQNHCAYSASKAGIIHLSKALAMEWAPYNVRVNCISPGYTATELTKDVIKPRWAERTPMKRVATPEDMQGAALYLASDASLYTTGIDILVDGGYCCW